ncbi:hypothetical protein BRAS3843_1910006 [Bradyrhizobium sp. STM 3843]|nr:hypothetical protein BRAS3843_1910006 [Bradyrhizobium sp. STM 3843]
MEESTWQHERGAEPITNVMRRISRSGDRFRDPAIALTSLESSGSSLMDLRKPSDVWRTESY